MNDKAESTMAATLAEQILQAKAKEKMLEGYMKRYPEGSPNWINLKLSLITTRAGKKSLLKKAGFIV